MTRQAKQRGGTLRTVVNGVVDVGSAIIEAKTGVKVPRKNKKKDAPKKRQTVAKIKRKIALLKAKKELAKLRGY